MDFYDEFLKGLIDAHQQPGIEPLWSFEQGGRTVSCILRHHGRMYGVEAQILSDGEILIGRRFDTKELAVHWADLKRKTLRHD
jgi:hypothetical protein